MFRFFILKKSLFPTYLKRMGMFRVKNDLKKSNVLEAWKWLWQLMGVFIVAIFLNQTVFMSIRVPTESMVPTIPKQSYSFGLRTSYLFSSPKRGDIVIFVKDGVYYIKRVVGLPGETIEIVNGITYINGRPYDESQWLAEPAADLDFGPFYLSDEQYFVMGDNRNNSFDCRYWEQHFIERNSIRAKYLFTDLK